MNPNPIRYTLFIILILSSALSFGQKKWDFDIGLGTTLHTGNVNTCNLNHYTSIVRNDSLLAFDFKYKLLYSSLINRNDSGNHWEETNFEINGGLKVDYLQYGKFSPFLACELLINKYKGYDLKLSGLIGVKYRIYVKPSFCDYSISAAFVYDWTDFTDETVLPNNNYRISIRPKIKQRLSENLMLLNLTFFQPSVLDIKDIIINNTTKLQTKLTKMLFLDLSFSYEYRSLVPSEKYKKHDFMTEVSLRVKF